jgi:Ca-activated chloride channel family protein
MNLDDPKLTSFALNELDEPDRSELSRAVAGSFEAQHYLAEVRELADALRNEFAADLQLEGEADASPGVVDDRRRGSSALHENAPTHASLSDIRDDPWFWSKARPLALAAVLALFAVIGALAVATYQFREGFLVAGPTAISSNVNLPTEISTPSDQLAEVEAEVKPTVSESRATVAIATPLNAERDLTLRNESGTPATTVASAKSSSEMAQKSVGAAPVAPPGVRTRMLKIGGSEFLSRSSVPDNRSGIREPFGEFNTAAYDHILENPFLDAKSNPLSTFSIDVDTASYSNLRRFISEGSLPPKDAVRVEEMINYFTYDYAQPGDGKPFAVHVDVAGCPWEASHRLVRIGLKGREIATDKRGASNLVFLLDVSGSMTPPERLPLVKQAMRLLAEKLTENDRVAIVVYAGASGLALPSTTGDHKEKILEALENLQPGGSTNGAEGIELAYKIAADNFIKGGVNRVILATDGDFNVGVTSQGDLIRLIEEKAKSGVFLSVLGVGTDNLKDSTMQKLADKGNGNYAYLDTIDEARKVLVQQMNGTLVTIAKDVKIQVEFNPARVASYRLIGYEKRMLRKEDFNNDKVDAGEIGAGHTVTALYEVTPVGATADPAASVPPVDALKYSTNADRGISDSAARDGGSYNSEMLTVKLRYKKPDADKSELLEQALIDQGTGFANAPADLKFAAAVAEFGMILRDSEFKGNGTLGSVLEWAQEGKGNDANGYRSGFIELVRKAQALKKG